MRISSHYRHMCFITIFYPITGEKPTSPVTIINDKPSENQSSEQEITPSKPVEQATPSSKAETLEDASSSSTSSSSAPSTHDKKPSTKSLFKSSTFSSHNTTSSKTKTVKATPKSQPTNTTPNKFVPKDKPKSTPPKIVTAVHKSETSTESNASPQVASTKKYVDKKGTTKVESSTKAPIKVKTDKLKSVTPHHHFNGTTHAKLTSKTEKPKTTNKVTTKSTTSMSSSTQHNSDGSEAHSSVVIASRVEVHEGPTSVQKVKKGDAEVATSSSVSPSAVEFRLQTEETKPLTAATESEKSSSEAPVTKEDDYSSSGSLSSPEEKRESTSSLSNSTEEPAIISSSGVLAPEYDFLSRQPSEVVDETYRVCTVLLLFTE